MLGFILQPNLRLLHQISCATPLHLKPNNLQPNNLQPNNLQPNNLQPSTFNLQPSTK
ncbi:MAG: hypothetical protein F6K55_09340 [Moorea sp. SIO4A3]|nr:hypothetical protein [Moorena sp. SIO4A3]